MKKFLFTTVTALLISNVIISQTTTPTPDVDKKEAEFDKKFRFGLRITPQPTWYATNDKNITTTGAKFGFGFGLNMEFRLSKIVALLTGVGGDFEGGKYSYKSDPANNYSVRYWQDNSASFIEPKKDGDGLDIRNANTTGYLLKERSIKTTHASIPVILKLSTNEYNGMKYYGLFGTEIGIRLKQLATDTYWESYKYNAAGLIISTNSSPESQSNIVLGKDGSAVPLRIGLNVGAGAEYRLGGSTSVFFSVNYFKSFTNQLKKSSNYIIYNSTNNSGSFTYDFIKQNLIQNAVRINIGVMF
jgi:hypothetical protein